MVRFGTQMIITKHLRKLGRGENKMKQYQDIIGKLNNKGILFDKGLSLSEITEIEKKFSITFPIELTRLYSIGLPVSDGFYNWRNNNEGNVRRIKEVLNMPLQGLIFDLESNNFWCDEFGKKPENINEARNLLVEHYKRAPQMIPIYGHRYMPFLPDETSIPVFSIMQSDIIYYGIDLVSYLEIEFGLKQYGELMQMNIRYVDFWSDLL